MKIDLHTHTTFSDGECTPLEVLKLCKENEIKVVAITDHNNINGSKKAIEDNPYNDIMVIPGVELAATYKIKGGNLHILGYNVDLNNSQFNSVLKEIMQDNIRRIESLIYQLNKNYNISFKDEDISELFSASGNIGRPDVAKLCVKYGYSNSVKDAFDSLLKPINHKLVKRKVELSDKECVHYIQKAGGIACLAHPITLKKTIEEIREYVKTLASYGLEAIEVYYSLHDNDFREQLLNIANEFNLLYSAGSDFHGPIVKPNIELGSGINNNLNIESATILSKIFRSD